MAHKQLLGIRFARMTDRTSGGCWLWVGCVSPGGYGKMQHHGHSASAHKVAYEYYVGRVPSGLQLDHLCRNRRCVNPRHLEPVSAKENTNRGRRANSEKTHCLVGHPFDEANTYWRPLRNGKSGRDCKRCRAAAQARRMVKIKGKDFGLQRPVVAETESMPV